MSVILNPADGDLARSIVKEIRSNNTAICKVYIGGSGIEITNKGKKVADVNDGLIYVYPEDAWVFEDLSNYKHLLVVNR